MITTYLQGGLGNQMFQIAAAYAQAKKYNDESIFNLNNSHTPHQGENSSKYKGKLLQFNHMDNAYSICPNVFKQPNHSYCEIPYQQNQQLQGYYQSEKFFNNVKTELIDKFRLGLTSYTDKWNTITEDLNKLSRQQKTPIVSVHIRRGDYKKFPGIHDTCSIDYYNKALDIMAEKIGEFNVYFVSDDIKWCKNVFKEKGKFSMYTDEVDDMILMVNCDHNIIANSSFSWWGAYLNTNPNKIVIGPKHWFGPKGPKDQQDIIPKNWIKV